MRSVPLAVLASTLCACAVLLIVTAVVFEWRRRRRWARELDQEFPPDLH